MKPGGTRAMQLPGPVTVAAQCMAAVAGPEQCSPITVTDCSFSAASLF